MQILRLLAARRAATTIIAAPSKRRDTGGDDEGPFFDLDFTSSCSVRASSSSGSSGSDYDSDESCDDFIISLQRTRSGSLLFSGSGAPPLKFCASEPPLRANNSSQPQQHGARKRRIGTLRTMSFGASSSKKQLYGAGRHSFSRSSFSSTGSLRLFVDSSLPDATDDDDEQHAAEHAAEQTCRRAPSRNVIRRCLAKISRRLRTAPPSPHADARGLRSLRKCQSASSAARGDDSAVEKQDGIAGAIAHCKETLHRASTSGPYSPLLRPMNDPGKEM